MAKKLSTTKPQVKSEPLPKVTTDYNEMLQLINQRIHQEIEKQRLEDPSGTALTSKYRA